MLVWLVTTKTGKREMTAGTQTRLAWLPLERCMLIVLLCMPLVSALVCAQTGQETSGEFYVYAGAVDSRSVTLAWGTADSIGRSAHFQKPVTVRIADRSLPSTDSWIKVEGLEPDHEYSYAVEREGRQVGTGSVRTWPEQAESLVFFVIGDWGTGDSHQRQVAQRMTQEFTRLKQEGKYVRFVLSTGDNLYEKYKLFGSGASDEDWESRFFQPYREILKSVPFYAVPGNHDGNESEERGDLPQYLDNFFFPTGEPARWYAFEFGGLAEFFALDSTMNTLSGPPAPAYSPEGEQSGWLRERLQWPGPPWRIAILHHPMFSAGPEHPPALANLRHWLELFRANGVEVVFSGHEHNLQFSERSPRTGGIQFVVSGAGGRLRAGNIRARMREEAISAWAPQYHFCVVEVTPAEMLITPVSHGPLEVVDAGGRPVVVPLKVPRLAPSKN